MPTISEQLDFISRTGEGATLIVNIKADNRVQNDLAFLELLQEFKQAGIVTEKEIVLPSPLVGRRNSIIKNEDTITVKIHNDNFNADARVMSFEAGKLALLVYQAMTKYQVISLYMQERNTK